MGYKKIFSEIGASDIEKKKMRVPFTVGLNTSTTYIVLVGYIDELNLHNIS